MTSEPSTSSRMVEQYTPLMLTWYDVVVLGVVCPLVWRCHRREMVRWYDEHVGARHLELGPGTGHLLRRARLRTRVSGLVLVDLNGHVLRHSARRLARFGPTVYRRDVLEPLELPEQPFDSAGMNFLLHCLPGGMVAKASVFDHVARHVRPGGVVFGSTVLAEGVQHGPLAPAALRSLNADHTLANADDSLGSLDAELARRFPRHRLHVRGSVCFFQATVGTEPAETS